MTAPSLHSEQVTYVAACLRSLQGSAQRLLTMLVVVSTQPQTWLGWNFTASVFLFTIEETMTSIYCFIVSSSDQWCQMSESLLKAT